MKPWHDILMEMLKDPEEAAEYLNTALSEGDPKMFLVALRNVAEARGGLRKISRETRLNRSGLHRMLSKRGNPQVHTLADLLDSFGLRLAVETKNLKKAA